MAKRLKTLRVYPNPYLALDHEGRIAGACAFDPEHNGGRLLHIGAALHPELTKVLEVFPEGDARGSHTQDTVHEFSADAVDVPNSTYHQDALRNGEIFLAAADGTPPWVALAEARNRAVADWRAHWGEDPDTSLWPKLFPLDAQVATVAEALAAKAKAAAEKATADAKAAAEKAAVALKAETEKRASSTARSHVAALKDLGVAAPKDGGSK